MKIAADFSQRVVVHNDIHSTSLDWIASPMPGVTRRPLDRVGEEVARATTIVRYAPGSEFSAHCHTGGEEFIVLDGVFQDEHGDYPVGSYIRNPPQSIHQPSSKDGCVIFVKLWQFQPDDRRQIRLQTDLLASTLHPETKGVTVTPLYSDTFETVCLLHFEAGLQIPLDTTGGAELLVLAGSIDEQEDHLVKHSWLRTPINTTLNLTVGAKGATLWCKKDHLRDVEKQIKRVQES